MGVSKSRWLVDDDAHVESRERANSSVIKKHQSVMRVMDVAGKLGFLNLNISTVVPLGQPLPQ